ncbi:MAG: LacI family DNA-binding transcriptional regulator [Planctomycetota bacterium]
MASVRQVAAEAGVSPATVSRILNNDPDVDQGTRERVLGIANSLGYTPKIGRRINTVIGIALPSQLPPDLGAFDGALVSGASQAARDEGFRLAIVDLVAEKKPNEAYTQFFNRCGLRAIVLRRLPDLDKILEDLAREKFPHILIADRSDTDGVSWIDTDSKAPSRAAVKHLIDLGHRRIAVGHYRRGGVDTHDRVAGYVEAHEAAGLQVDESLIVDSGFTLEDGESFVNNVLSIPDPPTALYLTHSMSSLGALRRLLQRGVRIPEDVSIVGFDDCISRVYTHPLMSVVRQDTVDMAHRATKWLIRSLTHPDQDPMRESIPGVFDSNETTTLARDVPVRVLPDGRIAVKDIE